MNVIETKIPGVLILEPRVFKDARGYFFESYSQREFDEMICAVLGHPIHFVQDNESMSSYGVMRGLHYQRMPYTQSKLVRCVKGAVLDVAVDIRKGSPTFGQHVAVELTALLTVFPCFPRRQFSSTSAMHSIILHRMLASISRTSRSVSIGVFLLRKPSFRRRTCVMPICWMAHWILTLTIIFILSFRSNTTIEDEYSCNRC